MAEKAANDGCSVGLKSQRHLPPRGAPDQTNDGRCEPAPCPGGKKLYVLRRGASHNNSGLFLFSSGLQSRCQWFCNHQRTSLAAYSASYFLLVKWIKFLHAYDGGR